MAEFSASLHRYLRRPTRVVRIGGIEIGGDRPIAVQSMTNCDTNDTAACLAQTERIRAAGGRIVRLTAQGRREAESLARLAREVRGRQMDVALVADVHFLPSVAALAAESVDKVRINPGNYHDAGGEFEALLEKCRQRNVALRIGVNHGSLAPRIVDRWGDTPEGMVASAMEFLRVCRDRRFEPVVVSMKSSNTRVMVHAYRLLAREMAREGMDYPLHLGVTEAGNGLEGRIKSAVGIGALLADGLGDTIRVSLTEPPEREIPVALSLVDYFADRVAHAPIEPLRDPSLYHPYAYEPRRSIASGRIGGGNVPVIWGELSAGERLAAGRDYLLLESTTGNAPAEWRSAVLNRSAAGDRRPVILSKRYDVADAESLALQAAADFGMLFLDGLADGLRIEAPSVSQEIIDEISLLILQASRVRMSRTEYIACPGCGRTLYALEQTLARIKSATSHLPGLKIGVMGCIVNGPGEMADADYGYVGAGPGRITLYRGREVVRKAIPEAEALDALVDLLRSDGRWIDKPLER